MNAVCGNHLLELRRPRFTSLPQVVRTFTELQRGKQSCTQQLSDAQRLTCIKTAVTVVEYLWQSTLLVVKIALLILVAKYKCRAHDRWLVRCN